VLSARGLANNGQAKHFLSPSIEEIHDPFLMDGMEVAVERIEAAIKAGETIWVHGDYDVDGTASTSMMLLFLREIGAQVQYFIPDRQADGYGLSTTSINRAREAGATLIITVDCGITSVDSVRLAKSYGIDTIVCDHHEPGESQPEAVAILDPIKPGCNYPFKYLAACGVAYKLVQALAINRGESERANQYLDFVAVASAADIVPLIGENRVLVYAGLQLLNAWPRPGFKGLLDCADMARNNLTTSSIIFGLAPRINAAGRVGSARRAVEMMIQSDDVAAFTIAQELERDNRTRRTLDEFTFDQAYREAEKYLSGPNRRSLVLHKPDWHAGVIGIVASRLVEKFHVPSIMLTTLDDHAKGSARSIKDFDLHGALKSCERFLLEFGGHKHAAGLSLSEANIPAFREEFNAIASSAITDDMMVPELLIDAELQLNELSPHFLDVLKRFAPYGHHNPKPVFYSQNVVSANGVKIVGNNHLKFRALQSHFTIDAIGFNLGDKMSLCRNGRPFSIAYTLEENNHNGSTMPQISIKDLRPDAG
jgi:single-stranded-DNA-specific exonuclease